MKFKTEKIQRVYHPWHKWECYKAGFYDRAKAETLQKGKEKYSKFFSRLDFFQQGIDSTFKNWPYSCEHFLTNDSINRIAWIGQASMCIMHHVSCFHRSGFFLLTREQQKDANMLALKNLNFWIQNKKAEIAMKEKINQYINKWKGQGYESGIPDKVPDILADLNLAPSYRAIALCILRNDHTLKGLGFSPPGESDWYHVFKKIELSERKGQKIGKRIIARQLHI